MIGDAREHLAQARFRVQAVEFCCSDQPIDRRGAFTADIRSSELPPLVLWSGLSAVTFLLLLVLFWRHNQSTHMRRYSQWERSLLCQRCGTLTEQEF